MTARRWLPLSGLLFVVIALVAIIGLSGDVPDTTASGEEVAQFYDEEDIRQAIGAFVWVASIPFLVLFAATVAVRTRRSATRPVWEYLLVGGSVMLGAILALLAAIVFALTDGATNDVSPSALEALNLVLGDGWVAFNGALGVMMLGAAGCFLAGAGPRWLGWIAVVLGVALFVPYADFIALLASLLWIVVVSILLTRSAPALREPAT